MPAPARRIGLTQRVEVVPSYGERRDCLDQAWTGLLLGLGLIPVPLPNRTDDPSALLSALELDGVILTGGNDFSDLPGATNTAPERDVFEAQLLDYCAAHDMPVLGVCRGLQVLVRHYGGRLSELRDHVATRHGLELEGSPSIALRSRESVNSYHRFGVLEEGLGEHLVPLARAPDGSIEAAAHVSLRQWGIMWHPEREPMDASGDEARLLRSIWPT